MIFWQVTSIAVGARSFILVHWISGFLATSAPTTDKNRLNSELKEIQKVDGDIRRIRNITRMNERCKTTEMLREL